MAEIKLDQALSRLDEIVKKLESNEIDLEDSLKIFEEGIKLSRICHKKLSEAEKKIELLVSADDSGVMTKGLKSDD